MREMWQKPETKILAGLVVVLALGAVQVQLTGRTEYLVVPLAVIGALGLLGFYLSLRSEMTMMEEVVLALLLGAALIITTVSAVGGNPYPLITFLSVLGLLTLVYLANEASKVEREQPEIDWDRVFRTPPPNPELREAVLPPRGLSRPAPPAPGPERQPLPVSPGVAALYAGRSCAICGEAIPAGTSFSECPVCREWYHDDCWSRVGHCVTPECPNAPLRTTAVIAAERPVRETADYRVTHVVGICPYCQSPIVAGEQTVRCSGCQIPHHLECWRENQGCSTYGCRNAPAP